MFVVYVSTYSYLLLPRVTSRTQMFTMALQWEDEETAAEDVPRSSYARRSATPPPPLHAVIECASSLFSTVMRADYYMNDRCSATTAATTHLSSPPKPNEDCERGELESEGTTDAALPYYCIWKAFLWDETHPQGPVADTDGSPHRWVPLWSSAQLSHTAAIFLLPHDVRREEHGSSSSSSEHDTVQRYMAAAMATTTAAAARYLPPSPAMPSCPSWPHHGKYDVHITFRPGGTATRNAGCGSCSSCLTAAACSSPYAHPQICEPIAVHTPSPPLRYPTTNLHRHPVCQCQLNSFAWRLTCVFESLQQQRLLLDPQQEQEQQHLLQANPEAAERLMKLLSQLVTAAVQHQQRLTLPTAAPLDDRSDAEGDANEGHTFVGNFRLLGFQRHWIPAALQCPEAIHGIYDILLLLLVPEKRKGTDQPLPQVQRQPPLVPGKAAGAASRVAPPTAASSHLQRCSSCQKIRHHYDAAAAAGGSKEAVDDHHHHGLTTTAASSTQHQARSEAPGIRKKKNCGSKKPKFTLQF